jgi:hypothetical protein
LFLDDRGENDEGDESDEDMTVEVELAYIGLLHLIPIPPLSRTSFSKGEISHFFQRGNWEKWKKNALSRGVKKQKCTSRGGSSLFQQRGQLHRFFCIPEG